MPSEVIQSRANVARVLSPGKLRNLPRMKLWKQSRESGNSRPTLTYCLDRRQQGPSVKATRPRAHTYKSLPPPTKERLSKRTIKTLLTSRWLHSEDRDAHSEQAKRHRQRHTSALYVLLRGKEGRKATIRTWS